jgi:hypothetical protein
MLRLALVSLPTSVLDLPDWRGKRVTRVPELSLEGDGLSEGERSLRWMYCNSDGVRSPGVPVTNLSHSVSFYSLKRTTPSNHGTR